MKKLIYGLVVLSILGGCASAGNDKIRTETPESVSKSVVKGVTTKAQIKALYGEPGAVSLTDGGNEVWHYAYVYSKANAASYIPIVGIFAGGAHVSKNEIVFIIDKDNVVQNYTVHASEQDVQRGGKSLDDKK